MVEIQIQDKKYEIPTEWKDITLEWWYGLYSIIQKHTKPQLDQKTLEIKEDKLDELQILKMNRDVFKYLTGVNDDYLKKLDLESVNDAVVTVTSLLEEYKPKGIQSFKFDGETYFFPKEFLKRNTFGDYIEATQLDATIEIMKHGKFDILPEQMAILCRTLHEKYDDEAIPEKTDKFKKLTMDIVWEFSFFLTMQSVRLTKTFQTYLEGDQKEVSKPVKEESLQKDSIKNTSDLMVG
tara:strand:+ start:1119 stop:1829 length:711 start_codon:yes stop_codon:yes gene_type:complete